MSAAFHTLTLQVSHAEHAALKQEAKQMGVNLTTLLRLKMGLPRVVVRDGEDVNEIENFGHLIRQFVRLVELCEDSNMLTTMVARELGISRQRLAEARLARTPQAPEELAAGYSR